MPAEQNTQQTTVAHVSYIDIRGVDQSKTVRAWKYLGHPDQVAPTILRSDITGRQERNHMVLQEDIEGGAANTIMSPGINNYGDEAGNSEPPYWWSSYAEGDGVVEDYCRHLGFEAITDAHRWRGHAYLLCRFRSYDIAGDLLGGGPPEIKAVVKGHKAYDPRKDADASKRQPTTSLTLTAADYTHDFDDEDTWEWTDNPILLAAMYERKYRRTKHRRFGTVREGRMYEQYRWDHIAESADYCDELVLVPGPTYGTVAPSGVDLANFNTHEDLNGVTVWPDILNDVICEGSEGSGNIQRCYRIVGLTPQGENIEQDLSDQEVTEFEEGLVASNIAVREKRFTCNGVLSLGDSPKRNIEAILATCAGQRILEGGKVAYYPARWFEPFNPNDPITEERIGTSFSLRTGVPYNERVNTIVGVFPDRERSWKETQMPPISLKEYQDRDGGESSETVSFELVTNTWQCQRLAWIHLRRNAEQRYLTLPVDLCGLRIMPNANVNVTVESFNVDQQHNVNDDIFRCIDWRYSREEGTITANLQSDRESIYQDPALSEYNRLRPDGTFEFGDLPVPPPTDLALDGVVGGIRATWTLPEDLSRVSYVELWFSPEDHWDAVDDDGNLHRQVVFRGLASVAFIPLPGGEKRYAWIRSHA